MEITPEIKERIVALSEKYQASGQDLLAFLDGLLYADYITYWDYIHLDTLLSLQNPRTPIPDEEIFIMYHQITELYFKLCLHEINQVAQEESISGQLLKTRLIRINRYFEALTHSFGVMVDGMDREQFLKFRMALIPASGFQSAQYRMIEIGATPFEYLVDKDFREALKNASLEEQYARIYWRNGATISGSGEKTLTLKQFEDKYDESLLRLVKHMQGKTLWDAYEGLPESEKNDEGLIAALRLLDLNVNVYWPLQHYRSAVQYLAKRPDDIRATGGTNWQKYLPPRFQKRIFYPTLWSEQELEEWGKPWVDKVLEDLKKSMKG